MQASRVVIMPWAPPGLMNTLLPHLHADGGTDRGDLLGR